MMDQTIQDATLREARRAAALRSIDRIMSPKPGETWRESAAVERYAAFKSLNPTPAPLTTEYLSDLKEALLYA